MRWPAMWVPAGAAARRPGRGARRRPASGLNTTEVREWAKAQGIEVKDRGRLSADLVARFKAASGQQRGPTSAAKRFQSTLSGGHPGMQGIIRSCR